MTLSSLARLLLRRWYIAVVGLLLTGANAALVLDVVKPEYNAVGSILLLPPAEPGANPYLDLGAVPGVPDVISRVLHDSAYADTYEEEGIDDYEVAPDQSAGGPAVLVTGRGASGDEALAAMQTVMADVLPVLEVLQDEAGVQSRNRITGRNIYVETEATKVGKKQTRALIAVVGLGAVATLGLLIAVDALLALRVRRRPRRESESSDTDDDETDSGSPTSVAPPSPAPSLATVPDTRPEAERTSKRSSKRTSKRTSQRPSQHPVKRGSNRPPPRPRPGATPAPDGG